MSTADQQEKKVEILATDTVREVRGKAFRKFAISVRSSGYGYRVVVPVKACGLCLGLRAEVVCANGWAVVYAEMMPSSNASCACELVDCSQIGSLGSPNDCSSAVSSCSQALEAY